jgi:hypothetical protein
MFLREWLDQRALLNHDILCNQLRNELCALRADATHNAAVRLKTWPRREPEYRRLFDATLEALSPAQLVDSAVFACWNEDMKRNFRPVFHELFVATSGVAEQVRDLHQLLSKSLEGVKVYLATPQAKRTAEAVASLQTVLDALSAAISALPKEIGAIK